MMKPTREFTNVILVMFFNLYSTTSMTVHLTSLAKSQNNKSNCLSTRCQIDHKFT